MANTPRLNLPEISQTQAQKEVTHNEALSQLDALVQCSAINYTTTAPPGSPSSGDTYLIASPATGAWENYDNYIAYYDGSAWDLTEPQDGFYAWDQNSNGIRVYQANTSPPEWTLLATITGSLAFTDLTDAPVSYSGYGAYLIRVNAGETGLEFASATSYTYTNEMAQDAVGGIVTDSTTINFTYTDSPASITGSVITQMSITSDASGVKLSGDATSPGNSKLYGTDGSGTKGWYDQTSAYTNEMAQDAVGTLLTDSTTVNFTYTDSPASITASVITAHAATQLTPSGSPLSVTPAVGTLDQFCYITSVSGALTINNATGTPANWQKLVIRIKSAASQTLSFGADYRGSTDLALPTATTGSSKTDYFMFAYNTADSKWDYMAKTMGF